MDPQGVRGEGLGQGWATLFASRATLEASKVYTGQYMYSKAKHYD